MPTNTQIKHQGRSKRLPEKDQVFDYALKPADEVIKKLATNFSTGLNSSSVAAQRMKFGLNSLTLKEFSAWYIFLRQFHSSFVYLLIGAMAITVFLGEYVDTLMIFIFLAINAGLGFVQEYRSEKTVKLLNKYTLPRTKVLRNGQVELVASEQLVPGDVVILTTSDRVPADIRIIEQNN